MYQQPDPNRDPYPAGSTSRRRRPVPTAILAALLASAATLAVVYSSDRTRTVSGAGAGARAGSAGPPGPAVDRHESRNAPAPSSRTGPTRAATAEQQVGIVDVVTVLKYQGATAAGTGMVLTPSGQVLTNNHVVSGATSITVRVVSTGKAYRATVVGTDPSQDVAVLQLQNASGLRTVVLGDSGALKVGDAVTGVGNAGGTNGTPTAATGTVVALNQPLTATDERGRNAETLTGMIATNAAIEAGDSGGPLFNASGQVVGMDTAGSASRGPASAGFAIPIVRAVAIAREIRAGHASATIHLGYPGFLGVSASTSAASSGALVDSVLAGGPAAKAGIAAGDLITAVGGVPVRSSSGLRAAVTARRPGQRVTVSLLDPAGKTHRVSLRLGTGPAD